MKVLITLDTYDGSKSKTREVDLENVSGQQLMYLMMQADVYGVTITKADTLLKGVQRMENTDGDVGNNGS